MNDIDKQLEEIERLYNKFWSKQGLFPSGVVDEIGYLISQVKAEREEKERLEKFIENLQVVHFAELQGEKATVEKYEKALKEITEVGWSPSFGGGIQYSGESHGDCIKIARKALGGDRE